MEKWKTRKTRKRRTPIINRKEKLGWTKGPKQTRSHNNDWPGGAFMGGPKKTSNGKGRGGGQTKKAINGGETGHPRVLTNQSQTDETPNRGDKTRKTQV